MSNDFVVIVAEDIVPSLSATPPMKCVKNMRQAALKLTYIKYHPRSIRSKIPPIPPATPPMIAGSFEEVLLSVLSTLPVMAEVEGVGDPDFVMESVTVKYDTVTCPPGRVVECMDVTTVTIVSGSGCCCSPSVLGVGFSGSSGGPSTHTVPYCVVNTVVRDCEVMRTGTDVMMVAEKGQRESWERRWDN